MRSDDSGERRTSHMTGQRRMPPAVIRERRFDVAIGHTHHTFHTEKPRPAAPFSCYEFPKQLTLLLPPALVRRREHFPFSVLATAQRSSLRTVNEPGPRDPNWTSRAEVDIRAEFTPMETAHLGFVESESVQFPPWQRLFSSHTCSSNDQAGWSFIWNVCDHGRVKIFGSSMVIS